MGKARVDFYAKARGRRITRLMARDGLDCRICLKPLDRHLRDPNSPFYITFDHILPVSRGGLTEMRNLQLAHRRCNERRGNDPIKLEDEPTLHWG